MHRIDFALMPQSHSERLKYGREMKNQLAIMQIELPSTPLPRIKEMALSDFEMLVYSEAWEKNCENNIENARFEILIKVISDAANAICKTLSSGFNALGSSLTRR